MSDISSLINVTSGAVNNILDSSLSSGRVNKTTDSQTFDGVFNAAIDLVSNTNQYLQEAQKAEVAFAMGELTSTHELAVIQQKANLSLQYTVAIKNQLINAYKEIMNMQI